MSVKARPVYCSTKVKPATPSARRLIEGGRRIVVLKAGAEGATALGSGCRIDCGVFPVEARKPYGAGDAFLGNLANALLQGRELADALRRGAAAAAIVVAKRGCTSAMPDGAELESFLASRQMTRESANRSSGQLACCPSQISIVIQY